MVHLIAIRMFQGRKPSLLLVGLFSVFSPKAQPALKPLADFNCQTMTCYPQNPLTAGPGGVWYGVSQFPSIGAIYSLAPNGSNGT